MKGLSCREAKGLPGFLRSWGSSTPRPLDLADRDDRPGLGQTDPKELKLAGSDP